MNHPTLFGPYLPQHHRQTTAMLVVMGREEHDQTDSLGQRFVTALKHTPALQQTTARRTPIVTTVAVDATHPSASFVAVSEDLHDLLVCTPQVLVVPWLPETETDRLLDAVKGTLPEPVAEQPLLRPTLTVQGAERFGPWGTPVNPQEQLDPYVQGYPGWHRRHTRFTSLAHRVVVLRSRPSGASSPLRTEEEHAIAQQAYHLVAAALDSTIPVSEQMRRDGAIYLNYLCAIVTETSQYLDEKQV